MPHSDLACPTECCELIANGEQVVHDNIHLEFACRGERTHLYSEVARRFQKTISINAKDVTILLLTFVYFIATNQLSQKRKNL